MQAHQCADFSLLYACWNEEGSDEKPVRYPAKVQSLDKAGVSTLWHHLGGLYLSVPLSSIQWEMAMVCAFCTSFLSLHTMKAIFSKEQKVIGYTDDLTIQPSNCTDDQDVLTLVENNCRDICLYVHPDT